MFSSKLLFVPLSVIGGVSGSHSQASELIRRIYKDGDSKAAYFIQAEADFVFTFMKGYPDVPVMSSEDGRGEEINDIVILVVIDATPDPEILERVIKRLRVRKYVVISARSEERLHQISARFWSWKFSRIFGAAQGTPYAFLNFANRLVPIASLDDPLPDAQRNLHGHYVRTAAQTDFPRVLRYPDGKGRLRIGGQYAMIFLGFLKMYNATFQEVVVTNSTTLDVPGIWRSIREGRVDVSVNNYGVMEKRDEVTYPTVSYPVHMLRWTVMTPIRGYLNPDQYFLRPFTLAVWGCIGGTLMYIILMDFLKDVAQGRTPNPWRCFTQTFLMMLNSSADGLIGGTTRIHVLIVLYAFILVNLYLNHLTSFLTVFIRIKQYDTLQDLIDNKVEFIVPDFLWAHATRTGEMPPQLVPIAHVVGFREFISEMMGMRNTSVSYLVVQDRAEFLIELQSLQGKPLFRLISDYIGIVHTGFMIDPHLPYAEVLGYYVLRCWEVGLVGKWGQESIWQVIQTGYRVGTGEKGEASAKPLSWNDLRFAWSSLAGGLVLALVVFLVEVWGRFVTARRVRSII